MMTAISKLGKKNRKKLVFAAILLFALVLTTGTFAYTYSGYANTQLDSAVAAEDITTCIPSAIQPPWFYVLPEGEYYSEILLPNGTGDDTNIPVHFPDFGEHWDKVDDLPADDGETYLATSSQALWKRDLYNLTNHREAEGYETVSSISVYFRFAATGEYNARAKAAIKTHGKVYQGYIETQHGTDFATRSYDWAKNPATNETWTWEEIDALQAGVSIMGRHDGPAICTQVYVKVNYEFVQTQGAVPLGNLFDIIPHPNYTGDLLVKLYLTNTSDLLKAYQYINMKLYVEGSLEAEKAPAYQILSMENGVAFFNIESGSAESYTIKIIGGSYRLISGDIEEWGEGWSIIPELYCEVSQR
jgi:hypothetical protein